MPMSREVQDVVRKAPQAYVATADARGVPHVAVSRRLRVLDADRIAFLDWFCPRTVANVRDNGSVSVVVWDPERNHGHQLLGEVVGSEVTAMMDGYSGSADESTHLPQEEREYTVRVTSVLEFKSGLHTDEGL